MKEPVNEFDIVKIGTFLYGELIECDIRIVYSNICYGTGDYEDSFECANDIEQDTFYLEYGSLTQRGVYNVSSRSFNSIEAAINEAESAIGFGHTVKWMEC